MAKKFAVSSTTTNTEKMSRNTPVKLVIFVFAALGCWDKDSPTIRGGVELVPLLVGILFSYSADEHR